MFVIYLHIDKQFNKLEVFIKVALSSYHLGNEENNYI